MYCKASHELQQNHIKLNGKIYSCENDEIISIDCDKRHNGCNGDAFKCNDKNYNKSNKNGGTNEIFCLNGTLYSKIEIFCNKSDYKSLVLECYNGQLPSYMVSFIPTTKPALLTEGQSGLRKFLNFFLDLLGFTSKAAEGEKIAEAQSEQSNWIPQALEIPPAPITTPEPHIYLVKSNDNKAIWHYYRSLSDIYLRSEKLKVPMSSFERNNVRSFTITEYNHMKQNGEVVDF